ncbi:MAG TPA: hypothetical protein VGQ83_04110 [Polyangia bacterium]|jgi:hypothetical protein
MRTARPTRLALLPLLVALPLAGCGTRYDRVPADQVDPARRTTAEELATRILTAWNKHEYPFLGAEATAEFRRAHNNAAAQKAAAANIEKRAGRFQSLAFAEELRSRPPQHDVFRFKGTFSDVSPVEVRVVLDPEGKVSGFWVRPWHDELR